MAAHTLRVRNGTLLFTHDQNVVLRSDGTVLKFFAGPMADLLEETLALLHTGTQTRESAVAALTARASLDDVTAIFGVLDKYDLIECCAPLSGTTQPHPLVIINAHASFSACGAFVSQQGKAAGVSSHVDTSPGDLLSALATLTAGPLSGAVPLVVLPSHDARLIRTMNRAFLARGQHWFLAFEHEGCDLFASHRPGLTACAECLWPLLVAEMPLEGVRFHAVRDAPSAQQHLRLSVMVENARRAFEVNSETANGHILKFDFGALSQSRVARLKQPRCPACAPDVLGAVQGGVPC